MRVVHIARRFHPMLGGTERYVRDLAAAQARRGHVVRVLTLDRDVTGVHPGRLSTHDTLGAITIVRVRGHGTQRLAVALDPRRVIHTLRTADVVHLHDLRLLFGTATVWAMGTGRPLIFHTHGLIFHTEWATRWKRLVVRGLVGPLLAGSHARVIASSTSDALRLTALAPYLADSVSAFGNAIELSPLLARQREPNRGLIVSVGRVVSSKGIDDLLTCLSLLDDRDWCLRCVGPISPDEGRRLLLLARRLGIGHRFELVGALSEDDMRATLSRAQLAVFPSRAEGFGIALLEAMAAGVPVIARDIPAHRELLLHSDERLVDFDVPEAAARKIAEALDRDPPLLRKEGEALRADARKYDVDVLAERIDALYRQPAP